MDKRSIQRFVQMPTLVPARPAVVFGAVYGLLSSAVMLTVPSVRAVRWRDKDRPMAGAPRPAARRTPPAGPPP